MGLQIITIMSICTLFLMISIFSVGMILNKKLNILITTVRCSCIEIHESVVDLIDKMRIK